MLTSDQTHHSASRAVAIMGPIAAAYAEHGLWFHVDAAHGGAAALSAAHRGRLAGIERADSVVIDAHKMMLVPALCTLVLFRDGRASAGAFAQEPAYVDGAFALATRLAQAIDRADDLELATPPDCNLVCFRWRTPGLDGTALDAAQRAIRSRLLAEGLFYLVQTTLPAGVFLRVTLINPLTTDHHLDDLLAAVRTAGRGLA